MQRRFAAILALATVICLAGCSATPLGHVNPVSGSESPSVTVQPAPAAFTSRHSVNELIDAFSEWGSDEQAPDALELDQQGQLFAVGDMGGHSLDDMNRYVKLWMKTPALDGLILETSPYSSLTVLSRNKYKTWGTASPAQSPPEWASKVDLFAPGSSESQPFSSDQTVHRVQAWVQDHAGKRLLQFSRNEEGNLSIHLTADTLTVSDRMNEAAAFALFAWLMDPSFRAIHVEYEGVTNVKTLDAKWDQIASWAENNCDPTLLSRLFRVDNGSQTSILPPSRRFSQWNLVALLNKSVDLQRLNLVGSSLRLGMGRNGRGRIGIESTLAQSVPWEDAWSKHQQVVEQMFALVPEVDVISVTLHKGQEVELWRYVRAQWAALQFLRQQSARDTDLTPIAGSFVYRYQVISP